MILLLLSHFLVALGGQWRHAAATEPSVRLLTPAELLSGPGCVSHTSATSSTRTVTCCLLSGYSALQSAADDAVQLPARTELLGGGSCGGSAGCDDTTSAGDLPPDCQPKDVVPRVALSTSVAPPTLPPSDSELVIDLGSNTALFWVPYGGRLTFQRINFRGALLPTTYPLPAASFLALSAVMIDPPPSPPPPGPMAAVPPPAGAPTAPPASPPPPLALSDLLISTPSCTALAVHQAFACSASPSPNFTVTPTSLVVHRFTGPVTDVTNVTLTCEGAAPPIPPCLAARAATGPELLAALASFDEHLAAGAHTVSNNGMTGAMTPAFLFLTQDLTLATAAETEAATVPPMLRPPSPRSITLSFARVTISGDDSALTVLDLANTTSLITLRGTAGITLRSLTLRNPPLGPSDADEARLMRAYIWTFAYQRQPLLFMPRMAPLSLLSVILELPREELAMWMAVGLGGVGAVPPDLRGDLCVVDVARPLLAEEGQVLAIMAAPGVDDDRDGGGSRLLWISGSSPRYLFILTNVSMVAADGSPSWTCRGGGGTAAADVAAAQPPSVCLYIPEGACGSGVAADLRYASSISPGVAPGLLNEASFDSWLSQVPFAFWTLRSTMYGVVDLDFGPQFESALLPQLRIPGFVTKPSVLMGSFGAPLALDVNLLPGALVLAPLAAAAAAMEAAKAAAAGPSAATPPRPPPAPAPDAAHNESLTVRAALLANLPPAGVFPGAVTRGSVTGGGSSGPTQGLPTALTNFTSCLWTVEFDRPAAQARYDILNGGGDSSSATGGAALDPGRPVGLPFVYLDTIALLVPQRELDALVWVWVKQADDKGAAAAAAVGGPVTWDRGLAEQLEQMLEESRLSQDSAAAVAQLARNVSGSSGGVRRSGLTRLTFERFWWCGLEGRYVDVVSVLPPAFQFDQEAEVAPLTVEPLDLALPLAVPYVSNYPPPPPPLPHAALTPSPPPSPSPPPPPRGLLIRVPPSPPFPPSPRRKPPPLPSPQRRSPPPLRSRPGPPPPRRAPRAAPLPPQPRRQSPPPIPTLIRIRRPPPSPLPRLHTAPPDRRRPSPQARRRPPPRSSRKPPPLPSPRRLVPRPSPRNKRTTTSG